MHGTDNGVRTRPDISVNLPQDVQVISVFGSANGSSVTSIGFNLSNGDAYDFGPGDGDPFSVDGLFLGFYGALQDTTVSTSKGKGAPLGGAISGIGVHYTEVTSTLPKPPWKMSPAYGNLVNVWTWDDTPDMGGAHHPFLLCHVPCQEARI
jgi:hypothetical protein